MSTITGNQVLPTSRSLADVLALKAVRLEPGQRTYAANAQDIPEELRGRIRFIERGSPESVAALARREAEEKREAEFWAEHIPRLISLTEGLIRETEGKIQHFRSSLEENGSQLSDTARADLENELTRARKRLASDQARLNFGRKIYGEALQALARWNNGSNPAGFNITT